MSKNKHKNTVPAETVVESNTSIMPEETTPVESPVVPNMSLNAADQAWVQALIEERIKNNNETEKVKREFSNFGKKLMKFLFTPAKKLDSETANVDTLSSITAFICTLTAYCGYLGSLGMIALALFAVVNEPALAVMAFSGGSIVVATLIAVFAKAIELAGIEIDKTQNNSLVLGAAAFWIAIWPIVRDFLAFVVDCL